MTPYRAAEVTSPPPAAEPYDPATYLPPRERDVLQAMAGGLTVPEMARRWYVSAGTVRGWQQSLYKRLGVNTGTHAVAVAFRRGVLAADPDVTAAVALLRQAAGLGYRLAVVPWPVGEEIADAIEAEALRMRREDFRSARPGIGYINGFEDAARIAREYAPRSPETAEPPPAGVTGRPGPAETATARQEIR